MWRPVLSRDVAALRIQNMWRSAKGRKDLRALARRVWATRLFHVVQLDSRAGAYFAITVQPTGTLLR